MTRQEICRRRIESLRERYHKRASWLVDIERA